MNIRRADIQESVNQKKRIEITDEAELVEFEIDEYFEIVDMIDEGRRIETGKRWIPLFC